MTAVQTEDGREVTSKEDVLREVQLFYGKLWSKTETEKSKLQAEYLTTIKHQHLESTQVRRTTNGL